MMTPPVAPPSKAQCDTAATFNAVRAKFRPGSNGKPAKPHKIG
jgi:hypothetical protein